MYLWAKAVNTIYILNRTTTTPNSKLDTVFEMWTGKPPVLDHIKTFGCEAFMHVSKEIRDKLGPISKKLTFVGYEDNSMNYHLFDTETKRIKVSRNVLFKKMEDCLKKERTLQR